MAAERHWFIIRTNIRCEQRAVRSLRAKGYRAYLPVMRKDVFQRRKRVMVTRKFVLFNRYLFVGIPADRLDFYTARRCDGVECFLGINGQPARVSRETVARFLMAQRRGEFNDLLPKTKKDAARSRFPVGSRLRVRGGDHPFGGFYGRVSKIKGRGVVRAMLDIFGGLTPVDLRFEDIEPAVDNIPNAA